MYQVVIYHLVEAAREVDFFGKKISNAPKRRQNREFVSDCEPAVSSVFQQKLWMGQHTYIEDLWSYERL